MGKSPHFVPLPNPEATGRSPGLPPPLQEGDEAGLVPSAGWLAGGRPLCPSVACPMASDLETHSLFDISLTQICGEGKCTQPQGSELGDKASQTLVSALEESLGVAL